VTELLDDYPEADSQQLRQLIRNAQKEIAAAKPPKSARMLYRYLKELLQSDYLSPEEDEAEADDEDVFDEDRDER